MDGRVRRALGILAASALALAGPAGAATFTVDATADAVDAAPGNGVCAAANGACTLRAAIMEANASAGPDAVTLPAGTFLLTLVGPLEDAGLTGDLDVLQPLEITGAGPDATVIDGIAADRVFHVPGGAPSLTLRALAVRNGNAGPGPGGGVLHVGAAPLVLDDVRFRNNRATVAGGGVAKSSAGTVTIIGATFEDNRAESGAGLAHAGAAAVLDVRDSTFANNRGADGGRGGGVAVSTTAAASFAGTVFRGNTADQGGGIAADGPSQLTLDGCTFEDNRAFGTTANGGAGFLENLGGIVVRDTAVRGNLANANIGGIYAETGSATVTGSTFDDNRALISLGGLYLVGTGPGAQVVEDTAFRRNAAEFGIGGGLYAVGGGSQTVTRVVAEDNFAYAVGGGMLLISSADVTVAESRISRNVSVTAPQGGMLVNATTALLVRDTLVEDNLALTAGGAQLVGATVAVERSTFARNVASGPGAVGGALLLSGATTIENSTFTDNLATTTGGAIYSGASSLTVSSCTFVGNVASDTGSAIYDSTASATVRGTVITGGIGTAACAPAAPASGGDNVDADGTCALAGPRDRSGLDPQLGPLQDNGGPTPTHEPLEGSPLVDADAGTCPATDQRGVARPFDADGDGTAACDVGAVEFLDECPQDPAKRVAGVCGCGVADVDGNANGAVDCLVNAELKARIATEKTNMQAITGAKDDAQKALKATVKAGADDLVAYVDANGPGIVPADPAADLGKLATKARKLVRRTLKGKGKALQKKQAKAATALDTLDAAVAPQP